MFNIRIGRYDDPSKTGGWAGSVEPDDKSWILFLAEDGGVQFYADRDEDGGVIGDPTVRAAPELRTGAEGD